MDTVFANIVSTINTGIVPDLLVAISGLVIISLIVMGWRFLVSLLDMHSYASGIYDEPEDSDDLESKEKAQKRGGMNGN